MATSPEPALEEQLWTIAVARLLFGSGMSIQAPPNFYRGLASLVRAGINDWGGVSPVTPDHVNPEAPWPHLEDLARSTDAAGRDLVERSRADTSLCGAARDLDGCGDHAARTAG